MKKFRKTFINLLQINGLLLLISSCCCFICTDKKGPQDNVPSKSPLSLFDFRTPKQKKSEVASEKPTKPTEWDDVVNQVKRTLAKTDVAMNVSALEKVMQKLQPMDTKVISDWKFSWEGNSLVAKGEITLNFKDDFLTLGDLEIEFEGEDEDSNFCTVSSIGKTKYIHTGTSDDDALMVMCRGKVTLDLQQRQIVMDSAWGADADSVLSQQVVVKDKTGTMWANQLRISLSMLDTPPIMELVMEGDVKIHGHAPGISKGPDHSEYFAIGNKLYYNSQTQDLQLFGSEKQKMIFVSRTHGIQMSGGGIAIGKKGSNEKEVVRALSDVDMQVSLQDWQKLLSKLQMGPQAKT